MSRKDYVAIAKAIKYQIEQTNSEAAHGMAERIACDLCAILRRDNSAFDSPRFLAACGFEPFPKV